MQLIILSILLGAIVSTIFIFLSSENPQTDRERVNQRINELREQLNKKEDIVQHIKEMINIKKERIQSLIERYANYKEAQQKLALEKDWWNKKKLQLVNVNLPIEVLYNIANSNPNHTENSKTITAQILQNLYGDAGHPEDRFALEQLLQLEMERNTAPGIEIDLSEILTEEELAPYIQEEPYLSDSETTSMNLHTPENEHDLESHHPELEQIFQSNVCLNNQEPLLHQDPTQHESNSDMIRDEMEKGDVNGMGHHLHDEQNKPYEHDAADPFPYEEPPARFTMADFEVNDEPATAEDFPHDQMDDPIYENDLYETDPIEMDPYTDPYDDTNEPYTYDDYGDDRY